ncbi:MAG TPA: matrixin family metalloprotease [Ignavibacteriaceae bacterium]|jgi:predicted Zn-dependent protease|nr:MAG: Matrixin [Ignavibacteria bacterium ADurb.Bin266]OQY70561.1 MAG: hypothetical protein B6D44_15545 [Ignavibacteriales bacterium UTCHB2]HQF43499.1 matrixin family metalloprotease [Ignavibacteriaceae bacterium]HQI42044.1 matrixin family metalloprotease [Ignavibacteriaceae bacterium]HQJ46509.1 matrixin family metalloprotease [Ignavibacteriaceae bacterium]
MIIFKRIFFLFCISVILFASTDIQAQKQYHERKQKSSSLKSSASDTYYSTDKNYSSRKNVEPDLSYSDNNTKNRHNNTSEIKNLYSENYFRIDKKGNTLWDGKHWEESRFPLNIYVKGSDSRYFKSSYTEYVKYALDVWRKADDRIMYNFVDSKNHADISVIFVENLGDEYEENYLGLTDYDTDENKLIDYSTIQISLLKNGNEKVPAGELKATIIHEFGHALGLGHSKNEKDLMYPYISSSHTPDMNYDELSIGDKLAIKTLLDLSYDKKYVLRQ